MARPLLIFDLDGTLLDTAPDLLAALNAVLHESGLGSVDRSAVQRNFGQGARSLIEEGFRRANRPLAPERIDELVARFITLYGERIAADTAAFPGAVAAMDRLQARDIALAVCTNKRSHLARPLLAQLGLLPRFAAVLGGDSLPVRKPDPGHILGTIAAADGLPDRSVMVGDSDADILASKAAGIPVIGVSFGYSPLPIGDLAPDAVIDHFDELDAALARVSPAFAAALR